MGVSVAPVARFGGLDLASAPDESACIDLLNVDLDRSGSVRSRDGSVDFTSSSAADPYVNAWVRRDGDVLAARAGNVDSLTSAGAVAATQATAATYAYQYADIGVVPLANYTYFSTAATERLRRWDGSAFASPANNPGSLYVAVQPTDGRLVAARIPSTLPTGSSATVSPSLVHFATPGAPDTWGADDWVQLEPGGDTITGAIAWRELLFIFKETQFFVFYGNSVDSTGGTVFNYRTVDVGVGARFGNYAPLVASAPDAVYFVGTDYRVYRTTGGPPVAVSEPIQPALQDTQGPFSQVTSVGAVVNSLTYADGRLVFNYGGETAVSGSGQQLVYDIQGNYWLYWDYPALSFAANPTNSPQQYPFYFANSTTNDVSRVDREATTDDGTAISSHYRTGFADLGYPGRVKDIDGTRVWGTGTVAVSGSRDFGSLDTATNVTLGTSPAIAAGLHNKQKLGEMISYKFASVSGGAWAVHRYAHYLRDFLPPDER